VGWAGGIVCVGGAHRRKRIARMLQRKAPSMYWTEMAPDKLLPVVRGPPGTTPSDGKRPMGFLAAVKASQAGQQEARSWSVPADLMMGTGVGKREGGGEGGGEEDVEGDVPFQLSYSVDYTRPQRIAIRFTTPLAAAAKGDDTEVSVDGMEGEVAADGELAGIPQASSPTASSPSLDDSLDSPATSPNSPSSAGERAAGAERAVGADGCALGAAGGTRATKVGRVVSRGKGKLTVVEETTWRARDALRVCM
jgi:hypothetical protein